MPQRPGLCPAHAGRVTQGEGRSSALVPTLAAVDAGEGFESLIDRSRDFVSTCRSWATSALSISVAGHAILLTPERLEVAGSGGGDGQVRRRKAVPRHWATQRYPTATARTARGRDCQFAAKPDSSPSARPPVCSTAAVGELCELVVPARSRRSSTAASRWSPMIDATTCLHGAHGHRSRQHCLSATPHLLVNQSRRLRRLSQSSQDEPRALGWTLQSDCRHRSR